VRLRTLDLVFDAELRGDGAMPTFWGTTLRGAFGFSLKNTVCHVSHRQCDRCILRTRCAYPVIFEGIPPDDRTFMRKYPHVPQPFVLSFDYPAPAAVRAGDRFRFGMRLFGPAADVFPFAVYAVLRMEDSGLGRHRTPFRIHTVTDGRRLLYRHGDHGIRTPTIDCIALDARERPASRLRVRFATPTRLRVDGRLTGDMDVAAVFRALLRRFRILTYFYGESEPDHDASAAFAQVDRARVLHCDLAWQDVPRYSSRQQDRMSLGGFVGHMDLELPPGELGQWFAIAERIHIGKATSFGFGRIICEELTHE